jgi:hypothetical protein
MATTLTKLGAVSPEGNEIIGTLEIIEGTARGSVTLNAKGTLEIEYEGQTDVDWNSQKTKIRGNERLFVCSKHCIWSEGEVKKATREKRPAAGQKMRPTKAAVIKTQLQTGHAPAEDPT